MSSPDNTNQQTPPLRRAVYVKVIDLATTNKFDVVKIKELTAKKKAEKSAKTASPNDDDIQECYSVQSGQNPARYQKRIIPSTGGFNLCLLVHDVNVVVEKTRVDKSQVRLAECEVGDETGTVSIRARDDQISLLQEISKRQGAVVLRNCSLELYRGKFIRLAISKWGKISAYPDGIGSTPTPPTRIDDELNLSIINLNEVVGDEWFENSSSPPNQRENSSTESSRGRNDPKNQSHKQNQTFRDQNKSHQHQQQKSGGHGYQRNQNHHHINYAPHLMAMNMNPNMAPGIDSFSMQSMYSNYGYGPTKMQNTHQQQHYDPFQHYNMHMQLEAMRLYQQQAPHHHHQHQHQHQHLHPHHQHQHQHQHQQQDQSGRHMFAHPPLGLPQGHMMHQEAHNETIMNFPLNANIASDASITPSANELSPDLPLHTDYQHSGAILSQRNDSVNESDTWSISREAESPMMNPHAATFTSQYGPPPLSLPPQHYYSSQPVTYGFTPTAYGSPKHASIREFTYGSSPAPPPQDSKKDAHKIH